MSRPVPICHRTIYGATRIDEDGSFEKTMAGARCIGSDCSAWWPETRRRVGAGRSTTIEATGLGACRDFGPGTLHEQVLWPDPAPGG